MNARVTILGSGTSQGVPIITCGCEVCTSSDSRDQRLRSSIMIEHEDTTLIVDTGPDFRQQMLRERVMKLSGIVYTHEHKDHIAGLDEVRAYNYANNWRAQVYCTETVEAALRREFAYAFYETKYPGVPEIDLNRIDTAPFQIGTIPITPIQVYHLNMPVLGFRMGDFTYITDANRIDSSEREKIRGSRVLVLNALRHDWHPSHFTLQEAIELAEELEVPEVYFTHISHQLGMHEKVCAALPKGRSLAFDGLKFPIHI